MSVELLKFLASQHELLAQGFTGGLAGYATWRTGRAVGIERFRRSVVRGWSHGEKDVFVSYSQDMVYWNGIVKAEIDSHDLDLRKFDWRDVDPFRLKTGVAWQDAIGAPFESGAKVVIVLLGERVGRPLTVEFSRCEEVRERLKACDRSWVHVPKHEDDRPQDGQVPLTGVLFEYFDVYTRLAELQKERPVVVVACYGERTSTGDLDLGFGTWAKESFARAHQRDREIVQKASAEQTTWLKLFLKKQFDNQPGLRFFSTENQLREIVSDALNARLGLGPGKRSTVLPGPDSYSSEHEGLFFPQTAASERLIAAVIERGERRKLVVLEGPSGSGKSSLIQAWLLPRITGDGQRESGNHVVHLDCRGAIEEGVDPVRWIGSELYRQLPRDIRKELMTVLKLLQKGDSGGALKTLEVILDGGGDAEGDWSPRRHLSVVVDQFEALANAAQEDGPDTQATRQARDFLLRIGRIPAPGAAPERSKSTGGLSVTVVLAVASEIARELEPELPDDRKTIPLDGTLRGAELSSVMTKTLRKLGIEVPDGALEDVQRRAVSRFSDRIPVPFVATALWRLQQRWYELARPSAGLNRADVLTYGDVDNSIQRLGDLAWEGIKKAEPEITGQVYQLRIDQHRLVVEREKVTPIGIAFHRLMRRLVTWSKKERLALKSVDQARLAAPELTVAGKMLNFRLLGRRPGNKVRLTHGKVLEAWSEAASWARQEQAALIEERRLIELADDLKRRRSRLGSKPEVDSLGLGDEQIEAAFELYSSRGNDLDLRAQQLVRELFSHKAKSDAEFAKNGLLVAAAVGDDKLVKKLAASNAEAKEATAGGSANALHLASQNGHRGAVKVLIGAGLKVNAKTADNFTALHLAAQNGHADLVEMLIRHDADLNATTKDGGTPLHLASGFGHDKVVAGFVRQKKVNWNDTTRRGSTALHLAAQHGYVKVVKILVAHENVRRAVLNDDGDAALHVAIRNGHLDVVRALLVDASDLDLRIGREVPPLALAIEHDAYGIAELLFEKGASISPGWEQELLTRAQRSSDRRVFELVLARLGTEAGEKAKQRCLVEAVFARDRRMAERLLEAGASPDSWTPERDTVLGLAISQANVLMIQLLLERGARLDIADAVGRMALHKACESDHRETFEQIVSLASALEAKDEAGWTPLTVVAARGRHEFVQVLLEKGAQVGARDNRQRTPLHWAAEGGKAEAVKMLLGYSADRAARDQAGDTALLLAERNGHSSVVKILGGITPPPPPSGGWIVRFEPEIATRMEIKGRIIGKLSGGTRPRLDATMHFEPGLNESEWDKLETKLVRIERSPDLPRLFKLVPRLVQGGQTLHVHLYSEDPWEEFAEGPYVFSYHLKGRRRQRRRAG